MTVIANPVRIKDHLERTLKETRDIAAKAQAEDRDFTPGEDARVRELLERAKQLKEDLKQSKKEGGLWDDVRALGAMLGVGPDGKAKGFSQGLGGTWATKFVDYVGTKGITTPSGGLRLPSPVLDVQRDPEQPNFAQDLIPSESLSTAKYSYLRQTARTNEAAPVAAGATKPESAYTLERVEDEVATIAHIVDDVNRADLADASFLKDFIRAEMFLGLREAVDDQVINGDGTGANLTGILETSGIQSQEFTLDILTTLRKAVTKLQMVFIQPTGLLLHPTNAEEIDLTVDLDGRYYFSGPQASGASPVWSVPVVVTPTIEVGTALMGDFKGSARIFSREEAALDFTEALGFKENTVTFRAELRMGLAVLRPLGFVTVELEPAAVT